MFKIIPRISCKSPSLSQELGMSFSPNFPTNLVKIRTVLYNNSNVFLSLLVSEGLVPRSDWVSSTLSLLFRKSGDGLWIWIKHIGARTVCAAGDERGLGRQRGEGRQGRQGGRRACGTTGSPRETRAGGAFSWIPLPSFFWGNN